MSEKSSGGRKLSLRFISLCLLSALLFSLAMFAWKSGQIGDWRSSRTVAMRRLEQTLPGCIIVGVRKCGTRAMLRFLDLHSLIQTYNGREIHFFDRDGRYRKGLDWYRTRMPWTEPGQITIEKTPGYFHTLPVPARMKRMNASVKLLLVVRDPVVRLVSDYTQLLSAKKFRGKSYASLPELALLVNGSVNRDYHAVQVGLYALHFSRWLQYFPRRQIHVVDGEILVSNPVAELRKVEDFLALPHRISTDSFVFDSTKGFFCPVRKGKVRCLARSKGRKHVPISSTLKITLQEFYEPKNEKFCQMVGRRFGWCSYSHG